MDDLTFLRRAIALSKQSVESDGGPFGAVVVHGGQIVGESGNQVTQDLDPTAHVEVMAIRMACRTIGDFSLAGGVIYTSCEPCPMCLGAIYWARLDRMVYANYRDDAAVIGFDDRHIYEELAKPIGERTLPAKRLLADEASSAWRNKGEKTSY